MTLKMIILRSSFSFQALTFRLTFVTFASISRNFSPPTYNGRKVGCSSTGLCKPGRNRAGQITLGASWTRAFRGEQSSWYLRREGI